MKNSVFEMRWTILTAVVVGYMLSPFTQLGASTFFKMYDALWPVVTAHGELVSRDTDSIYVHITGTKHRDCQYLQMDSYYTTPAGMLRDANEFRTDQLPVDGTSKPTGLFDIGIWRVFPVSEASSVQMYVEHSCAGRLVVTKIAEVTL